MVFKFLKKELAFYAKTLFLVEAVILLFGGAYCAFWHGLNFVYGEQAITLGNTSYSSVMYTISPLLMLLVTVVLFMMMLLLVFYRIQKQYYSKDVCLTSPTAYLFTSIIMTMIAQVTTSVVWLIFFSLAYGGGGPWSSESDEWGLFFGYLFIIILFASPYMIFYFSLPVYIHFSSAFGHVMSPRYKVWVSIGMFMIVVCVSGIISSIAYPLYCVAFILHDILSMVNPTSQGVSTIIFMILMIVIYVAALFVLLFTDVMLVCLTRKIMVHRLCPDENKDFERLDIPV